MSKLDYSDDAKNVLHRFYRVNKMVYVEGDDDIDFWSPMFKMFYGESVEVVPVGGKDELSKYVEKIKSGLLNALIAKDRDFGEFDGTSISHPSVITTAGYSIENTIISRKSMSKMARSMGRLNENLVSYQEFENWINEFCRSCEMLVVYDIHNRINKGGVCMVPDSCERFLVSQRSCQICIIKVNEYLHSKGVLGLVEPNDYNHLLSTLGQRVLDYIRGHFLMSAAQKFIDLLLKREGAKVSISKDAFVGGIKMAFELTFDEEHAHYRYYHREFRRLKIARSRNKMGTGQ